MGSGSIWFWGLIRELWVREAETPRVLNRGLNPVPKTVLGGSWDLVSTVISTLAGNIAD